MLRQLMASAVAHVCGHLHTLANLVSRLYGRHPSGHLELELADFKDNRRCVLIEGGVWWLPEVGMGEGERARERGEEEGLGGERRI